MASAFVASRFTLPHDDTPASATRASVTGTGDDGAASVAGARVHLPFSSLSSFLFPTLPPSCFCFSLCALPLSLFLFIFYPNHTHRALHSAPSPPHCMFTFSAAVVVRCLSNGGGALRPCPAHIWARQRREGRSFFSRSVSSRSTAPHAPASPRRLTSRSRHREPVARECPTICSFPTTL